MNFSLQTGYVLFRLVLPTLIFAFQFLLYLRTKRWIRESSPQHRAPLIVLRVFFLTFNGGLLVVALVRPVMTDITDLFRYAAMYPFFIWHGATLFLGLVFGIAALVRMIVKALTWVFTRPTQVRQAVDQLRSNPSFHRFDASRRRFLRQGAYGLTAVSFAGSSYGIFLGRSAYEITAASFPIQALPQGLDGFSIALLSDIHSSTFMTRPEMEHYVRLVNGLQADMIVVAGDFVNGQNAEVYPFAEAFSQLRAPCGVYGVMGNHDFYAPDPALIAREVDHCGIRLLRNEGTVVTKDGAQLSVLGIDDTGSVRTASARMAFALRQVPQELPRILICHRPYFLDEAAAQGMDLVLSGHTHGGQIVLGNLGGLALTPASFASKYVWGSYQSGKTQMYVSRGIGTVGVPMRINCRPEITKITLMDRVPAAPVQP